MISDIKERRESKKLTQDEVAKVLWITRQTYWKIEKWVTNLSLGQAIKLSELLEFDLNNLVINDVKTESSDNFDFEKYYQIIMNFIELWKDANWRMTKTKLAKLCYLLDFSWYYFNLKPITGLEYRKYQFGPVPDKYFTALTFLEEEGKIGLSNKSKAILIYNIEVPSRDKLSEDELDLMKKIAEKWKNKQTSEIVDFTHKQLPWLVCNDMEKIPYDLITQEELENVY